MRQQPEGADLLNVARSALRSQLSGLPAETRHVFLMIANAMSIAERQLRSGDAVIREELTRVSRIVSETSCETDSASEPDMQQGLVRLNAALAKSIRAGIGDPAETGSEEILVHLREMTRNRLMESDPKLLHDARCCR